MVPSSPLSATRRSVGFLHVFLDFWSLTVSGTFLPGDSKMEGIDLDDYGQGWYGGDDVHPLVKAASPINPPIDIQTSASCS